MRWTQEELSRQLQRYYHVPLPPRVVSSIETGMRRPTPELLVALAQMFNTTTDYLLGLRDDPGLDVPGLPVPDPDIAGLVTRLNSLDDDTRHRLASAFGGILDVVEDERVKARLADERGHFVRLFAKLAPDEQAALVAELEQRFRR